MAYIEFHKIDLNAHEQLENPVIHQIKDNNLY